MTDLIVFLVRGLAVIVLFGALPAPPGSAQDACGRKEIAVAGGCASFEDAADGLRAIIAEAMEAKDLSAAILRVTYGDAEIITEAWGESMTDVPATVEMRFRSGSVAIPFMTTVLLQLQEQGVLDLDDPLSKWFAAYPRADEITLRMLANNTSGYADYVDLAVLPLHEDVFRRWTPNDLVKIGLAKPMVCDPGACFSYAHTNYVILGLVIREVTGVGLARSIRDGVSGPFGLKSTRNSDTPEIREPVLHSFTSERGLFEDSTFWNPSWTLARGAVMTTDIVDMAASAVGIGTGVALSDASFEEMTAPATAALGRLTPELYYGLGIVVNNTWLLQTPSFYGYSGAMAYQPANRIALALMVTDGPNSPDERLGEDLMYRIGAYLAPDLPPKPFQR